MERKERDADRQRDIGQRQTETAQRIHRADGEIRVLEHGEQSYPAEDRECDTEFAVLSGGQGTDEPITEAECMYRELVNLGIDPQRLWMEEDATSTWENLHFSLDLIEERTGARPQKLGVLSSEYHLYRASRFAKACGVEFVGIPAKTSRLSQKINHFMREVAGVWHYILLGGQYD